MSSTASKADRLLDVGFGYWSHTHLTVDLVKGRGSGFSLEAPEGFRFMIRSRLFTEEELTDLVAVS